jgi:hypothetical protein
VHDLEQRDERIGIGVCPRADNHTGRFAHLS